MSNNIPEQITIRASQACFAHLTTEAIILRTMMKQIGETENGNLLNSIYLINFSKLNPKRKLNKKIYHQILLNYSFGWIYEYLATMLTSDEDRLLITEGSLVIIYRLLNDMGAPKIEKNSGQLLIINKINNLMGDKSVNREDQNAICILGKLSASEEIDARLIDVLNEYMKFQY